MHWDICVFQSVPVPQHCIYTSFLAQVRTFASGTSSATSNGEIDIYDGRVYKILYLQI